MAVLSRASRRDVRLLLLLCPSLLLTLAFRCPGPDPEEGETSEGGGGGDGGGGSGTTSGITSATTASVTTGGPCNPMMVDSDPMNCGACGRPCSMAGVDQVACVAGFCESSCLDGLDNDSLPPAPQPDDGCEVIEPHKRVFLTSDPHLANFGGAFAGDGICQSTATAVGLGGTWMAWLSDKASSPLARFTQSPIPYRLLDGTKVADDWADLISGDIDAPINHTELGETLPFHEVWTGTSELGGPVGYPCAGWTQNVVSYDAWVGRTELTDYTWTAVFTQTCERDNVRLYCFEQ